MKNAALTADSPASTEGGNLGGDRDALRPACRKTDTSEPISIIAQLDGSGTTAARPN